MMVSHTRRRKRGGRSVNLASSLRHHVNLTFSVERWFKLTIATCAVTDKAKRDISPPPACFLGKVRDDSPHAKNKCFIY
jgi:hypothetical protein